MERADRACEQVFGRHGIAKSENLDFPMVLHRFLSYGKFAFGAWKGQLWHGKTIFCHGRLVVGHERRASGAWKVHMGHCEQGFGCHVAAKNRKMLVFHLFLSIF